MAIATPERIAAAPCPHIGRCRILPSQATVALPIPHRATQLHVTLLRLRTIAVIRRIPPQPIGARPRLNRPVRVATVDIAVEAAVTAAAVLVAAVVTEEAVVVTEAAVVPGEAVLPAGILPEAPRAAARE